MIYSSAKMSREDKLSFSSTLWCGGGGTAQIIASGIKALQGFALLVAAIVHDYRHRGVNNGYLIKVKDQSQPSRMGGAVLWLEFAPPLPAQGCRRSVTYYIILLLLCYFISNRGSGDACSTIPNTSPDGEPLHIPVSERSWI